MKIEVITKPYEVTDQAGVKNEKLLMSKVKVNDSGEEYETILAWHINTKNYFLLKEGSDNDNLGGSFAFTGDCDDDVVNDFLEINKKDTEVSSGKSSTNWIHVTY